MFKCLEGQSVFPSNALLHLTYIQTPAFAITLAEFSKL